MTRQTQRIAYIGLLAALALVLSGVEAMVPLPVSIPGVKLGLANICVLFALVVFDARTALILVVVKVAATALLFGSLFSLVYSAAGSLLAFCGMWALWRSRRFNIVAVSVTGAVLHTAGQLAIAVCITQTPLILLNLPLLALAACITGSLTGVVANTAITALPRKLTRLALAPAASNRPRAAKASRPPDSAVQRHLARPTAPCKGISLARHRLASPGGTGRKGGGAARSKGGGAARSSSLTR
jgi:heptaprenyl diphosphate synthase